MLCLILAFLTTPSYSLSCYSGTSASLNVSIVNCTVNPFYQDSCISAIYNNPTVPTAQGTDIYLCGNCTLYSGLAFAGLARNVSCCFGDSCQTIAPPPSPASCTALPDEATCVLRPDCYWCGASPTALFGVGLCQSWIDFTAPPGPVLPCFGLPLAVVPTLCGSVSCPPANPPYTVNKLTLEFLTAFGLPAIGSNQTVAIGVALDALSRYADTRYLNDTFAFCQTNSEIENWCGVNKTHPFQYCIVSETWPQPDVYGWILNTTFTGGGLNPIFPAFCPCNYPGRAYYIPVSKVDGVQHYSTLCPVESTILAFYILLMVASFIVFLFVIWDTVILIVFSVQRKKGFTIGNTLIVKVIMIFYFLVTIPAQALFMNPPYLNNTFNIVSGVLRLLGVILVMFSFSQAVFTFIEIMLEAKVFGERKHAIMLSAFKWCFFIVVGFFLIASIGLLGAFSYYAHYASEFWAPNVTVLGVYANNASYLVKALMLVLVITQASMLIVVGILLVVLNYNLRLLAGKRSGMKDLWARDFGLILAWIMGIPYVGLFAFLTVLVAWVLWGSVESYWDSAYDTQIAYLWFMWATFVAELLWIIPIAYSMRTVVKKSWIVVQFRSLLGVSGTRSGSQGAMSGGTASTATSTNQSFEDD